MIGERERTVTFCANGEEVMFDAKSTQYYSKDMIGCFIAQVLDRGEEEEMKKNLLNELANDGCLIYDSYDSPCIWDDDLEGRDHEEGLIEELCIFADLDVKDGCEKRCLYEGSMEFNEEYCPFLESIANMIEGCCLF